MATTNSASETHDIDAMVRSGLALTDAAGAEGQVELKRPFDLGGWQGMEDLLPYDGVRGTVHRSAVAKTGYFVGRTDEDGGAPRIMGHESGLERVVAMKTLLHPNTYGLKVQPKTVTFE